MKQTDILEERVMYHVNMMLELQKNGSLKIVAGELNPLFYNHILNILSFIWIAKEKNVDVKIIAGPVICCESEYMSIKFEADNLFRNAFLKWIDPAVNTQILRLKQKNGKLLLTGIKTTVQSINEILRGNLIIKIISSSAIELDPERKIYWMNKICYGPNANLYEKLRERHITKFSRDQWVFGVWPLFAGYYGSFEYLFGSLIFFYTNNQNLLKGFKSRELTDQNSARIIELEKGLFCLPHNKQDLIANANFLLEKSKRVRNTEPNWLGKKSIGPTALWNEVLYQKQARSLKEVVKTIKRIKI